MKYICSHPKAKSYVTKACHVASWQKRPLTVQNENNKQAIANDSKQQIILHTRALRWCICFRGAKNNITLVYIGTFLPPECNQSRWKTSSKKTPKRRKQRRSNKEATKEEKNDLNRWTRNVWHMDWPWCHSFLPLLRGGQIGVARWYQGEPSHQTWLSLH